MLNTKSDQSEFRNPQSAIPCPLISVVVCTYNRSDVLSGALDSLMNQTLNQPDYEVIVVDNNSTDDTCHVAGGFSANHRNLFYHLETKQGLSHARNLGWKVARGDYVGYVDDDCKMPDQFLTVAKDIVKRISPVAFGGPSYAFYNSSKPVLYKDSYASHEPYENPRYLDEQECVNIFGMNMFFQRSVLATVGGFDPNYGMVGDTVYYGEETVLLKRISEIYANQSIYYDPRLYVYHLVMAHKMSINWILKSAFGRGRFTYNRSHPTPLESMSALHEIISAILGTLITFGALSIDLIKALFSRNREQYPYFFNYVCEHSSRYVYNFGRLWEKLRKRPLPLNPT